MKFSHSHEQHSPTVLFVMQKETKRKRPEEKGEAENQRMWKVTVALQPGSALPESSGTTAGPSGTNLPHVCTGARSLAGNCNGDPVLCCSVAHYLFPTQRRHRESPHDHPSILRRQRETHLAGLFADGRAHLSWWAQRHWMRTLKMEASVDQWNRR